MRARLAILFGVSGVVGLWCPHASASGDKVDVCHGGPAEPIRVSSSALSAHLAHGDHVPATWYLDADGDGFGSAVAPTQACAPPPGHVSDATDCDDADARVAPGASETCDGRDEDCDGAVDEAGAAGEVTWYADADGDGFGDVDDAVRSCDQPAGFVPDGTDCDDTSAAVNPAAAEACGIGDDDCDGLVDEPDALGASIWYADRDADGYGDPADRLSACEAPASYVAGAGDCDDLDATVNPGALEVCNGADDDCDGGADGDDAADTQAWYADADADGYGDGGTYVLACERPPGFLADATDCDDADGGVHPGALEVCDGIDNDCVRGADEPTASGATTWYADPDGDGCGDPYDTAVACARPVGYVDATCDGGCLQVPAEFATIQAAIDAVPEGGCVDVGPGTYPERISFRGKGVTVSGDPVDRPVIDGSGGGPVVDFSHGEGLDAVLEHVEVTGGDPTGVRFFGGSGTLRDVEVRGNVGVQGAGIVVVDGEAHLYDVDVVDNLATSDGGGVYVAPRYTWNAGTLRWEGGRLERNRTTYAGGGLSLHGQAWIRDVAILDNEAADLGGGIDMTASAGLWLERAVIAGNRARRGGGVAAYYGNPNLLDVTVVGNHATDASEPAAGVYWNYGGGSGSFRNVIVAFNAGYGIWGGLPVDFAYNDVYGNPAGDYRYVTDPTDPDGPGHVYSTDPDFVSYGVGPTASWDLRLRRASPLVDRGDPALLDADGTRSDIGALDAAGAGECGSASTGTGSGTGVGVVVANGLAYVAAYNDGLLIYDAANTGSLVPIGLIPSSTFGGPVKDLAVDGDVVWVSAGEAVFAVDAWDPTAPVVAGWYEGATDFAPDGLALAWPYLYVAGGQAGLVVLDVASDPFWPTSLATYAGAPGFGPAVDVSVSGGLAGVSSGGNGFHVVDVTNAAAPWERARIATPDATYAVRLEGTWAWVAVRSAGLMLVDLSRPDAPIASTLDVGGWPQDVEQNGARVFLPLGFSGEATPGREAVAIVDVSDPRAPVLQGPLLSGVAPMAIDVSGGVAWVVGDRISGHGTETFALTCPSP